MNGSRDSVICRFAALAVLAGVLAFSPAFAQQPAPEQPPREQGFLASIGHWFDRQAEGISSYFRATRDRVENLGREAGVVARRTVDTAKDAADVIARVPNTRVVAGHEKCAVAPNGAPDCVSAASKICRSSGFSGGTSVDMTTAEVCPAHVYLAGRNSGPGCRTETFVSRALCQ